MKGVNIRMNIVKRYNISSIPQGTFKENPLVELWVIQLLQKNALAASVTADCTPTTHHCIIHTNGAFQPSNNWNWSKLWNNGMCCQTGNRVSKGEVEHVSETWAESKNLSTLNMLSCWKDKRMFNYNSYMFRYYLIQQDLFLLSFFFFI